MNETANESPVAIPAVPETIDAADAAEAIEPARAARRGSAAHTSRRHTEHGSHILRSKKSQRLMLALALIVSLLLLLAVSIISAIRVDDLTIDIQKAQSELFQTKQTLAKVMPELQQARKELSNLIKGQFPHLHELTPDKVIKLDNVYIKNIVFTVLQKNGKPQYEYRLVMENTSESMVRPDARVFVFDHRGAQIGMGEIADRVDMVPGESRSYSATLERFIDVEPRYFYVWTRGKPNSDFRSK